MVKFLGADNKEAVLEETVAASNDLAKLVLYLGVI